MRKEWEEYGGGRSEGKKRISAKEEDQRSVGVSGW